MLPLAVAWSSSDNNSLRYALLVLCMTSHFHVMGQIQIQACSQRRSELFTMTRQAAPINCASEDEVCYRRLSCWSPVFSERELMFTFAICCRPSVCLSVSSVVCNVHAPYSGGSNFRQYFYGIRCFDHPLTSTENFTEIVPGEPLLRGVKHNRGSQI